MMSAHSAVFPIVLTCDTNYFKYALVTLQSIISNATSPVVYHIYIVHVDISPEQQAMAKELVADYDHILVDFVYLDKFDANSFYCGVNISYISVATYLRLYIPVLFPHYDYILYLDCDIAVNMDVAQLMEYNLEDKLVGAVHDVYVEQCVVYDVANPQKLLSPEEYANLSPDYRYFNREYYEQTLGIYEVGAYFNAGVIYFNLQRIRALGLADAFLQAQQQIIDPVYRDQDILNYVVYRHGGYYRLPHKFNSRFENEQWKVIVPLQAEMFLEHEGYVHQSFPDNEITVLASGYYRVPRHIFHYISRVKPWNNLYMSAGWIWWCYAAKTPYFSELVQNCPHEFTNKIIAIFNTVAQIYLASPTSKQTSHFVQDKATARNIDFTMRQTIAIRENTQSLL